jgi:hypothetical protein
MGIILMAAGKSTAKDILHGVILDLNYERFENEWMLY